MSEEPSGGGRPAALTPRPAATRKRKPRLYARLRESAWRKLDRVLAADLAWSVAFGAVLVILLASQSWGRNHDMPEVGQIATHDLRARQDFDHLDEALTLERRLEARAAVPDVYIHDVSRGVHLARQLAQLFEQGREALARAERSEAEVARSLGERISREALRVLVKRDFDPLLEQALTDALREVLAAKVVGNKALLERRSAITLVPIPDDTPREVKRFDEFIDLTDARSRLRQELAQRIALGAAAKQALADLAASFVDANVYYDREATNRARQDAERAVKPIYVRVEQGDLLVHKGRRVTPEQVAKLQTAHRATRAQLGVAELLGLIVIASLIAFFLYRYTRYHQRSFKKVEHLHALVLLMIVSMLLLARLIQWLAWNVAEDLDAPFNQIGSYSYLIPVGAGSILVALLANGRIATVYSAFVALLFGAASRWDPYLMLWAMLVQCAGVYAITTYRERAALLRAGLVVGGVGAVTAVALETLRGSPHTLSHLYAGALAFIGGAVGVGLLISFSLPLLERVFHVLTDIRLLELSNVANPLLSELALKAPGSYNHSLVVGTLAEEASRAIGANPLFCRVAAFYHDIGKMNKPEYFVENQRGVNPHDRLSPSMSALIIASHVKEGIRLAREAGLPEQIVDIIPQHHGTRLMTYFYEKARSQADPALGPVKEEDFRYPGPKPLTREAAIFMLADAIEAAARTIDEPTANRLSEMIRKVTSSIVLDGELDSCDLTFHDLDRIQGAFLRCLVSMYHHRVDYPGFEFGKRGESRSDIRAARAGAEPRERPRVLRSS
jgi:putative nucleotidyltransferase with HDIG domain